MKIINQGVISKYPDRGSFMSNMCQVPDGGFLACQHVGSSLGAHDAKIEILRAQNLGDSWERLDNIDEYLNKENSCYRTPQLVYLSDGRLVLTVLNGKYTEGQVFESDGLQKIDNLILFSDNNGRSWTEPQILHADLPEDKYSYNRSGRILEISPDRLAIPFETWKPVGSDNPVDQKAFALFSENNGRTWPEFRMIADDKSGKLNMFDLNWNKLPDGRILAMLWVHLYNSHNYLNNHYVISEDQGRTWSDLIKTNIHGQVCFPVPLPDGRLFAVYNDREKGKQGIRGAISKDLPYFDLEDGILLYDAETEALLDDKEDGTFLESHLKITFGRPAANLLDDGTVLVFFWCTGDNIIQTRWVQIRID